MQNFSKMLTRFSLFLATSLMLISCGGSDSGSSSNQVIKPIPNEKVVYVCADGKSGADGSSWETCTAKIQDAITKAQTDNKDLWFLAGEYILSKTIILDKDTKLYGGFKGTENELKDRKLDTNATILSGDEKIRVLKTINLTDKSVLDGFVITKGKMANTYEYGAGMHNTSSHITINNVTFSKNYTGSGGAMYNKSSNPTLTNVSFVENSSGYGSAIYNIKSSPTIINASFSKNDVHFGGTIYNRKSHPKITNATFSQNTGEIIGNLIDNYDSNPTITNVTFTQNTSNVTSVAIYSDNSNPTIKNSIFWDNGIDNFYDPTLGLLAISNSIVKGVKLGEAPYKDKNNQNEDPKLSEAKTKIVNGVTHVYYDLEANSPAINAGNSDDNNETTDQINNPRKNGTIDIGAVEK